MQLQTESSEFFVKSNILCYPLKQHELSKVQFQLMKSKEIIGLVPCRKLKMNGAEYLFYLTDEKTQLYANIKKISQSDCIQIIKNMLQVLCGIRESGYLFLENLNLNPEKVYYDPELNSVFLIYIPVNDQMEANTSDMYWMITGLLELLISKSLLADTYAWKITAEYMKESVHSLKELCKYFENAFSGMGKSEEISYKKKENKLMLYSTNISAKVVFEIHDEPFVIGRNPKQTDGQIPPVCETVSGVHCKVEKQETDWTIVDEGSTNGTFLNNQRIQKKVPYRIVHGDHVRLGKTEFEVCIEG